MTILPVLIAISIGLGAIGLLAFMWSLNSGQYKDLEGAAERVLLDDDDKPVPSKTPGRTAETRKSHPTDDG